MRLLESARAGPRPPRGAGGPLRLLYVLKMFPRLSETFVLNEILALEAMGHEVTIVSRLNHAERLAHEAIEKVRGAVHYIPEDAPDFGRRALRSHLRVMVRAPRVYYRTARHARTPASRAAWRKFLQAGVVAREALRIGADHMHAHFLTGNTRVAMWASALSGISYSVTAHAKDIYANAAGPRGVRSRLDAAAFTVTISDYNRANLAALSARPERIHRIYNGVDLDRFHPGARRPDSMTGRPPYLLSIGRLVPKKGFEVLIAACGRLAAGGEDFRCDIIGAGEQRGALQQMIESSGVGGRVRLLGARVQEEMLRDFYPRADALVLPCVVAENGDRDGIPTVLVEAMAMEIPVVSTSVSGIPELVEPDRSGLLVEPGDPDALAGALRPLLREPARRSRLGAEGRRKVEREFDLRRNVAALADLYRCYATGRRRARAAAAPRPAAVLGR